MTKEAHHRRCCRRHLPRSRRYRPIPRRRRVVVAVEVVAIREVREGERRMQRCELEEESRVLDLAAVAGVVEVAAAVAGVVEVEGPRHQELGELQRALGRLLRVDCDARSSRPSGSVCTPGTRFVEELAPGEHVEPLEEVYMYERVGS